jgi:hypothetical protein
MMPLLPVRYYVCYEEEKKKKKKKKNNGSNGDRLFLNAGRVVLL